MTSVLHDADVREEGIAEGFKRGREEGREDTFYELVLSGDLSAEVAAKRMGCDLDTFETGMAEFRKSARKHNNLPDLP